MKLRTWIKWFVLLIKGHPGDWRNSGTNAVLSGTKGKPYGTLTSNPETYDPDYETDQLALPVKNPVLAFQEAMLDKDETKRPKILEAWIFEGRFDQHGKLIRDKKVLESLNGAWPKPYRIRHVVGHEAFSELQESSRTAWDTLPDNARRVKESRRARQEALTRLKEAKLVEDGFSLGYDAFLPFDNAQYTEWVSTMGGPFSKQLYQTDYMRMHGLAFEAWNHNPIAKRIVEIISQYAFGRRFKVRIKDPRKAKAWDAFDQLHKIRENVSNHWVREYIIYGEILINKKVWQLIDPSTVLDIITDPDNIDDVYYYHQQYSTAYQQFISSGSRIKSMDYIVRQLPADDIIHIKGNCVSNEKRGRSTLFSILGWLKRIKDLYNAQVIRQWLLSCFIWDDKVDGSAADVQAHASAYANMPVPGSIFAHNAAVERKPMPAVDAGGASAGSMIGEELLAFIATAVGIPKEFLNITSSAGGGSRAQALTSAEPFTKVIEDIQAKFEALLSQVAKACFEQAGLDYSDDDIEFLFPSVTKDTTTETLKNIALAETMGWLSKQTAGEMVAGELNVTSYDFKEEQGKIEKETEQNMNQTGATPTPPGGRLGPDSLTPQGNEGESEIHGNGKVALSNNLKTL